MPLFPPRLCWPAPTRNLSNVHARTKLTSAVFGISKEQRRQRVLDLIKEPPRPVPEGHASFEVVGLRPALVDALHKAFPNVERPTPLQREFLPAIDDGKDVLLKDATGTGKSLGLLLALLNKPRVAVQDRLRHDQGASSPINALFIVPHKDLAYQLLHWTTRITSNLPDNQGTTKTSMAQVLVRGTGVTVDEHIARLKEDPPHMLIGTPQAIWELMERDLPALQPEYISTVVVDEVDWLIPSVTRSAHPLKRINLERKFARHPPVVGKILDAVLQAQQTKPRMLEDEDTSWRDLTRAQKRQSGNRPPLQLVFSSATLRTDLRQLLEAREGWLTQGRANITMISGKSTRRRTLAASTAEVVHRSITHSVLLVNPDGVVKNIEGAVVIRPKPTSAPSIDETPEQQDDGELEEETDGFVVPDSVEDFLPLSRGGVEKPLTVSPAVLEAVATAFAMDVPRVALLVLPASAPVHSFVSDLRELGCNAHGLDLLSDERGRSHLLRGPSDVPVENPTLLVATEASTRGLDLPELSHVFMLDIPKGRKTDEYLHVAGRVGRFGRPGKVVSVLRTPRLGQDGKPHPSSASVRMERMLRRLGIVPAKLEHFD